jgi:hypothetical protein
MKPWTVILNGEVQEVSLPHDASIAMEHARARFGKNNVVAILAGTFKNRIYSGKFDTDR